MFCRNCRQDMGNRNECQFCGYNPALDENGATGQLKLVKITPKPVEITLNKTSNGCAITALIFSLFGIFIFPLFVTFPLAIAGFFRAKRCRTGRIQSLLSLLIMLAWIVLYGVIAYFVFAYAM